MAEGKYPIAVIPFTRLTPSACSALSCAIDDALDTFKRWRLSDSRRMKDARDLLKKVAARDSYGTTAKELRQVASAIQIANDFYVISRTLQGARLEPIAFELNQALRGSIERTANNAAFDIQTQFWLGTVLAHARLHPAIPDVANQRPDFVITVGTLQCGVEIKRPRSENGAVRALGGAASQLRSYGQPGIIILDLSDCLNVDALLLHRGLPSARTIIEGRFFPMATRLINRVDKYSLSDKFSRVIMVVMYVRFFNWTIGGDSDADIGFFFKSAIRPQACHGVITDHCSRIQDSLQRGFRIVSGNPLSLRFVTD